MLLGARVNRFLILLCLLFVQVSVASVPEPSFVIYGQVLSAQNQVRQNGMVVSAKYAGNHLSESSLSLENNYQYTLEIPLEAAIGDRNLYKARVGDVIHLEIAGEVVANLEVTDRGVTVMQNVNLPESFDSDGDGIYDSIEIADGKNPNDPNDPVQFGNLDLDGDGISNGSEFLMGTYDPFGDYDGDGFSNQDEYTLGTNPNDAYKMPKQLAEPGNYAPLHGHTESFTFLQNDQATDLVWDEQVSGKPTSILPVYWNADLYLDLVVATDQGKVFLLSGNEVGQFAAPSLLNLYSLPVGGSARIGMINIDGINAQEFWVFSHVNNKLYVYQRTAVGEPYGQSLWFDVSLPEISGDLALADINSDGAIDMLATGVDVAGQSQVSDTLVQFSGSWDGYTLGFNAPVQLAQKTYLSNSPIQIIPNIQEVGFDNKQDVIIKGVDQKLLVNLSFNGLNQADSSDVLTQKIVTQQTAAETASLFNQGIQLDTENGNTPMFFANLDAASSTTTDLIQYTGNIPENGFQFRVVSGVKNTKETDGDGVLDFKDLDAADPNSPIPNGHVDYDQDGIPYAIDGNHSGLEDFDNDGISDRFELENNLDPTNTADASQDSDGDGRSNYQEFQDGTDPQAKTSVATQDATMITSVRAFEAGTSDMLLMNTEIVVSSQNSASVKMFNLSNLSQMRTLQVDDNNGVSKILNSGNLLVAGNMGGAVEIWDANSAIRLARFEKSLASVTDMAIDGTALYVLHADGVFFEYNIETLAYVGNWTVYDGFLTSLLARNNTLYLQASAPEKIMFVWDANRKEVIYNITGNAECCEKVVAELSGETLILANSYSGSGIYATDIGNLNSQEVVADIDISAVRSLDSNIYVGRKSGVIERYSAVDGSFQGRVAAPYSQVREIELINGGFVSLHADGNVYFWDHK